MTAQRSTKVPKAFEETYAAITSMTDGFCREHLNEAYGELARRAAAALCRKRYRTSRPPRPQNVRVQVRRPAKPGAKNQGFPRPRGF